MPTAAPPMRSAPGALLPLKGEDCENDDVLPLVGVSCPHKWPQCPSNRTTSSSQGPLRLLRRHLPLKGEDCENDDVLPLVGELVRSA